MAKKKASGMISFSREVTYNYDLAYCDVSIFRVKAPRNVRRALGNLTTEAQANVNERMAKLKFERKLHANFIEGRDICVHLTFAPEFKPESREECKILMGKFIRRLKYAWEKAKIDLPFKWIYVIEGEDGKRIHVHMVMTGGLSAVKIKALWGMADIVNVNPLQPNKEGFRALAEYLNKQGHLADGEHRWYCSRNLKDPERREQNAKIPLDEVAELGEYIQNELEAGADVIPTAERYAPIEERYPDYYLAEATAKYIETFREWVIHIRLYRKDTPAGLAEQKRRRLEEREIEKRKALIRAFRGEGE